MELVECQHEVEFYEVTHPAGTFKDDLISTKKLTSNEISFLKEVDYIFLNKERYAVGKIAFDSDSKKFNIFVQERKMPPRRRDI